MPGNKLKPPYSKRIEAYCDAHGVAIPVGFHSRNTYRYALVDVTENPPKLLAVTSYMESDVIRQVTADRNRSRQLQILDFKRGRKLVYVEGKHLTETGRFSHELPNELKYLVDP